MSTTTLSVKERPILFSTPMVQAILEGRKTITRRVLKGIAAEIFWGIDEEDPNFKEYVAEFDNHPLCPYGQSGDIIWVRETWSKYSTPDCVGGVTTRYRYKADKIDECYQWKPSIHMPKAACRLKLEILSIRVERLQDISEEDAIREGIYKPLGSQFFQATNGNGPYGENPIQAFDNLWRSINGEQSWNANPWVWRIEFKKLERE